MLIDPPSWFDRGEVLRWAAGLLVALALHLLALFLWVRVGQAPVIQTAPAAVMMQFSAQAQSIRIQRVLPVGPPQVVTPSMRSQPDPQPETASDTQVNVDDSPRASEPEIVVKRQRSRQRKTADRKVEKVTKKVVRHRQEPDSVADANAQASASRTAVAPPGEASEISAPYDSQSRDTGNDDSWQARVLGYLARNHGYPAQALAAHIEGVVLTTVTIDRQGNIRSVQLKRSSGHAILDRHALQAIRRKSPIPRPPAHIIRTMNQLRLNIPVEFNVREYRTRQRM
ncbi:energy transducer TonB family protein [Advenella mimigardefordensis]|uniref:TonB C-terminal domain-containing protein n=1 Tax=Advenella mimigardefordensis (strain DSM 17166 / LMG 22922 / DPN7) TaxID=1247726 RepID=W0PJY7_ADVMD|nr:energy transducer TonB [Advenella mimigardefordensis]AHG65298.1 TonB C-terminal domain-containing protein [Advenella mimigardefordensis DPN7]